MTVEEEADAELDMMTKALMGRSYGSQFDYRSAVARAISYLISDDGCNIKVRIHGFMHCMPHWAAINGYPSMRSSARACGVSVEWIRRTRNKWCAVLDVPIPQQKEVMDANRNNRIRA